jgi:hypothetical protein
MKIGTRMTAIGAALLLSAAPALSQSVSTELAPGANMSAYHTYAWLNATAPSGMNPIAYQQIVADIEGSLNSKGYSKSDPADLSLVMTIGARDKTDIQTWGRWGLRTDVYQYTEGQLSLDVFDTKTKQALWHGQATKTVTPGKFSAAKASKTVTKLMKDFPATGAAPAAQ